MTLVRIPLIYNGVMSARHGNAVVAKMVGITNV